MERNFESRPTFKGSKPSSRGVPRLTNETTLLDHYMEGERGTPGIVCHDFATGINSTTLFDGNVSGKVWSAQRNLPLKTDNSVTLLTLTV